MMNNNPSSIARLAQQLKCAAGRRSHAPALWLLSDAARLACPRAAILALPRGAGFIFRHYESENREALGRRLCALCKRQGVVFLAAGDARLAQRIRADGVHLPQGLAHRIQSARMRRVNWLITASAHDVASLRRAVKAGADAVFVSPVFATKSHPGARPLGPIRFTAMLRRAPLPVIALGGIDGPNAQRLTGSGAYGLAAISGLAGNLAQ